MKHLALAAVALAQPSPGPGPGGNIIDVRPSPVGLVVHGRHDAARVVVAGVGAACPSFSPAGAAFGLCEQPHELLARWNGAMPGDLAGVHTVVHLPERTAVDLWFLGPQDVFGPWVSSWPVCRADWTMDGRTDSRDISAFLVDWIRSPPPGYDGEILRGDYDADGVADAADLAAFIAEWIRAVQR